MKNIITGLVLVFSILAFATSVSADCIGEYGQYGQPCPSYGIVVDKLVGKPGTSTDSNSYQYVDNLTTSDPRFIPDQVVFFKVKVKNTSTTKLTNVEVKDVVPSYLDPLEGPGSFNSTSREITFNAGDFNVDEEKTYIFKMKVLPQGSLPADKGLFCVTNFVKASTSNAYDDDTSQLCIEKQVTAAQAVPSAGPEFGILLMGGELALLGAGLYLKRKV